ncbi:MAG: BatA and WFA domain-containing protein [Verrucomicrobiales bacterium]|nr:BatA and WFA domain-containing protein [Verrucomicrobiales bacterium]
MQFLHPIYLWLLALAVIPVMLYLFRRKSKQVNVSTMVFFKTLAREHQESAWLRKLKKWLSFALTILVLLASVFSLSRLIRVGEGDGNYRTYVVLLDRSASMALEDENGVSRLDRAKQIIADRIESVPEDAGLALVVYDNRPLIIQPRTLIRREFLSRLDEIKIRPIAGDVSTAMDSALMLAGHETPALVIHAGDFGNPDVASPNLPDHVSVELVNVALETPVNVGITSFQIRKSPLEQDSYDVHAQVTLNRDAPEAREVHLELFVGGVPSQVRDFDLEPGDRETFEFRVRGAGGQILRVNVAAEGDSFALDDTVISPLPRSQPIVAVWIRENSDEKPQDAYTSLALSAIQESGTLELLAGTPEQWPLKHDIDAVIFDGWLPDEWPTDLPAVVINPPGSSGPIVAQKLESPIPYDSVRVGNEDHPVLFRVSSSRVALTQTSIFQPSGSFEPLWIAGREPILAAGEVEGQRLVVMAFSPQMSERLPLTASFPLLLGNSVFWAVEGSDEYKKRINNLSTGEFVDVEGETIAWTEWKNGGMRRRELPLDSTTIEMVRTGIWQTSSDMVGTSHLLSANESDLPGISKDELMKMEQSGVGKSGLGSLVRIFLTLIVVVLLLESWLFHRHAVY